MSSQSRGKASPNRTAGIRPFSLSILWLYRGRRPRREAQFQTAGSPVASDSRSDMRIEGARMAVTAVVGLQWGDEAKGKIVDLLTDQHEVVVRYLGGNNAGHTVMFQ